MNKVIEKRLRYHHLCHRVISYVAILATLGLSGLLLAVIRPATSHAARPSEIKSDTIVVQTVSPASNSTEMPRPAHTPTFIPTPQQHQAVVLYDTFVSLWQNPVGTERAGVTTLKSKTLIYVCDAASDSVTLRYQVALGPCDTAEPIGWMNNNTISPPIPPWPEARVTSFPVPTQTRTPQQYQAVVLFDTQIAVFRSPVGSDFATISTLKSKTIVFICNAAAFNSVIFRYEVALGPCYTVEPIGWMSSNTLSSPIPAWPEALVTVFPTPTAGPQSTWTPTETPSPTQTATPAPDARSMLQSNQALLIGAILLVLAGLGYLFWKIVSAPTNTEIYVRRGAALPASDDGRQGEVQPAYLAEVRRLITDRLDIEDLRTLCFDLGVDYDRLRGEGKGGKARELVALMHRQQRLPELMKLVQQLVKHETPAKDSSA